MKQSMRFAAALGGVAIIGVLVTWPFLEVGARRAVLGAAILAVGTQLPAHLLLKGWRTRNDRFFAAIGAGFALRVLIIAAGIAAFVIPGRAEPAPFLLALGGFLLASILAESCLEHRRLRADAAAVES